MEPVSWVSLGMVLQCLAFPVLPVSPDQTIYRIEREKKWHLWTSQDLSPGPSTAGCCFVFFLDVAEPNCMCMAVSHCCCPAKKKDMEEHVKCEKRGQHSPHHQLSLLSSPYYSRLVEFVTELTSSIEVSDIKTAPSPFRAQLMP